MVILVYQIHCRGLKNTNCSDLHVLGSGLGTKERQVRQDIYGPNTIEVQVKPITHLIIYEVIESSIDLLAIIGQLSKHTFFKK